MEAGVKSEMFRSKYATVFDGEVPVRRNRQDEAGQPWLDHGVFVPELMAGVDAQSRIRAGHIGEHQQGPP